MTSAPRLTVAIPCFNCADVIEGCVAAALESASQCSAFQELILVDGGSSDNTSEVCARLAVDARVRVISSERHSASSKRNAALSACETEYLVFTDPDCIPAPGWLSAFSEAAAEGVRLATGRVTPHGPGMETSIRKGAESRVYSPTFINRAFPFRPGSSNNYLIETALLREGGGFPEDVGPGTPNGVAEDAEVNYRALRAGVPIHFIANAEVAHRHPERPDQFIAKKRGYAVGLTYFMFKRYGDDPAVYVSFDVMCAHNLLRALIGVVTGRGLTARQHWAEFTGRLEGLRRAR
jgi:glycosyltransferase involved in cell wall biosynthesis